MKAPITILSLLCVLALGIAGLLMLGSDDPAERSARAVETGTSAVTQAGDPAAAGPRAPSEGEPAAGGGHREAQDAVAIPGAATVHLRGRVESDGPCGGGDPELTVYALHEPSTVAVLVAALGGEDDERARDLVSASAPVSPDGTFELSAPEGEEGLHLMALGLVLYGEASVAVDSARASESVTLPVRCGAAVVGSIAPP
ncbi:MAG: hypothetical protein QF903_16165, partial [Planctomycetota bacterium]|nr:hypothetical protein [Planctomycetota bacterium]